MSLLIEILILTVTYIDEHLLISCPEVMKDRGLIKIGHVSHVINHLKLRRVHLLTQILLKGFLLLNKK